MRILFYTGGVTGSGHIVLGSALAAAARRAGCAGDVSILSVETEFASLADRCGVPIETIPAEGLEALGPERYRESALYRAIEAARPDALVVDVHWFPLDSFIRELPCKKVILLRQIDPRYFRLRFPDRELVFRPGDYDLVLKIEPGFELPFASTEINPIVIRNQDEILTASAARADLGLGPDERTCLFAFNGSAGEGVEAWKSWSYLADEGWRMVRSDNREGGLFPAVDWFNAFDMLVCGAGYNAFWEARYFRKEAYFVPFPRNFEDQARRVALCSEHEFEENGADELIGRIESL